jgi:hypothetical protein
LSPWGLAFFGGEPITTTAHLCPRSCQARAVLARWLAVAVAAAPDLILWDEPHVDRHCCPPQAITALLLDLIHSTPLHIKHALYWNPARCPELPGALAHCCQTVGVDLYDPATIEAQLDLVLALCLAYGVEPSCWVRAFRLPAGDEGQIAVAVERARARGIKRVGVWGFRGSSGLSALACERPAEAWRVTLGAVAG